MREDILLRSSSTGGEDRVSLARVDLLWLFLNKDDMLGTEGLGFPAVGLGGDALEGSIVWSVSSFYSGACPYPALPNKYPFYARPPE